MDLPVGNLVRPVIIPEHLSLTILEQSSETKQVTLKVLMKQGTQLYKNPQSIQSCWGVKSGQFKH